MGIGEGVRIVCYILGMALPLAVQDMKQHFDRSVELTGLKDAPLARAMSQGGFDGPVYIITMGGCSCDLLVGGHHMPGRPEIVVKALHNILQDVERLALLKHWFTRPVHETSIHIEKDQNISLGQFEKKYPNVDEDIRYIVQAS